MKLNNVFHSLIICCCSKKRKCYICIWEYSKIVSVQPSISVFSPVHSFRWWICKINTHVKNTWIWKPFFLFLFHMDIMPFWPRTFWIGNIWINKWQRENLSPLGWWPLSCWMYVLVTHDEKKAYCFMRIDIWPECSTKVKYLLMSLRYKLW